MRTPILFSHGKRTRLECIAKPFPADQMKTIGHDNKFMQLNFDWLHSLLAGVLSVWSRKQP